MQWIIVSSAAVILAALLLYGYASNFILKKEYYPGTGIHTGESRRVKVVMLADLHGAKFGKANHRLIEKIREECPDMICIAGDMTVKNGKGTSSCLALCRELLTLCPVFYAMGNHEIRMESYEKYLSDLRRAGVTVLDNESTQLFIRGRKIAVFGLNIEEDYYHKFWEKKELTAETIRESLGMPCQDATSILLAHNPEYFETYCDWGADVIFSGHVHGGIARLPVIGGVIEPSLRLFPQYDAGRFVRGSSFMVLSRGLGTHHIRFRFFNLPEISVVEM